MERISRTSARNTPKEFTKKYPHDILDNSMGAPHKKVKKSPKNVKFNIPATLAEIPQIP